MKKIIILQSILFLSFISSAEADQKRCLLQVKGKTYLKGSCPIFIYPNQFGSFMIGTDGVIEKSIKKYFGQVLINENGIGQASWNAGDGTHAHDELGVVERKGACWLNKNVKVCAWD